MTTGKLYEAWIQQSLFNDQFSVLAGLHDLNSEFYVTEPAALFFNSSFGIGAELAQTGLNGPSIFPNTALALRLKAEPTKSVYLMAGAFNALAGNPDHPYGTHFRRRASDGDLLIVESGYRPGQSDTGGLAGKYAFGFWTYTTTFPHQITGNQETSHGGYAIAEQTLPHDIQLFARYGVASSGVNAITSNLSAGAVVTGLLPFREKDQFGIGYTRARLGDTFIEAQNSAGVSVPKAESVLEFSYRVEVLRGLALQPDLQWVINPGTDAALADAWVAAARLEISL